MVSEMMRSVPSGSVVVMAVLFHDTTPKGESLASTVTVAWVISPETKQKKTILSETFQFQVRMTIHKNKLKEKKKMEKKIWKICPVYKSERILKGNNLK